MSITVLRPPEIVNTKGPVLFLAGPIQGAKNWQQTAIEIISQNDLDLTIASPRKEYAPGAFEYNPQIDWEIAYRKRARKCGSILFWLAAQSEIGPKDERGFYRSYAQTTRGELFEDKVYHERDSIKLVIGIEKGYGNERYIRRRFGQDCPDVPIVTTLEETCAIATRLAIESAHS